MRRWVLAELDSSERLLEVARAMRERGFRRMDLYSPFPLEGSSEVLGLAPSRVPLVALVAGLAGASGGYLVQWFTNAVDYPLIVANRPLHSAPTFIPITFELGVLTAALAIFAALMLLFGFPRVAHPVFHVEAFRNASVDGFWLSVTGEVEEEAERAAAALRELGARQVSVVEEQVP